MELEDLANQIQQLAKDGCAIGKQNREAALENRKYIGDVKKQMWLIYSSLIVLLVALLGFAWNTTAHIENRVTEDWTTLKKELVEDSKTKTTEIKELKDHYGDLRTQVASDVSSINSTLTGVQKSLERIEEKVTRQGGNR